MIVDLVCLLSSVPSRPRRGSLLTTESVEMRGERQQGSAGHVVKKRYRRYCLAPVKVWSGGGAALWATARRVKGRLGGHAAADAILSPLAVVAATSEWANNVGA